MTPEEEAIRKLAKARAEMKLVEEKHWCDLSRLSDYRDLFLFVGFVLVVCGIGMINLPSAVIVAGLGLIMGSWLMSK